MNIPSLHIKCYNAKKSQGLWHKSISNHHVYHWHKDMINCQFLLLSSIWICFHYSDDITQMAKELLWEIKMFQVFIRHCLMLGHLISLKQLFQPFRPDQTKCHLQIMENQIPQELCTQCTDGIKPLTELMLTYQQRSSVAFTWKHKVLMNLIWNMSTNNTLTTTSKNIFSLIKWHYQNEIMNDISWHITPLWVELKINGLVQDCSNSIANALELLQSCTKPSR